MDQTGKQMGDFSKAMETLKKKKKNSKLKK